MTTTAGSAPSHPDAGHPAARWRFLVSCWLLIVAVLAVPAGGAHASVIDGLRMSSSTVITIDPSVPAVFTESSYRFTNVSPDRDLGDGRIRFFYFDRVIVPADPGAEFVEVRVNGRDAAFELVAEDGFAYLDIDLGYRLRYDRTAEVDVQWLIVGDAPRTGASFSRVNTAYASFPVFAHADDGRADVRIEAPKDWAFDYIGSNLERSQEDGMAVFSATDIEQPLDFWTIFTARNDDQLESTDVVVGDASFRVRSWPDDPEWAAFAVERITDGVPALESRIGAPWPSRRTTDVIETSTPYLRGYAGYYDGFADEISVGEDLDDAVILHELAHAWFNNLGYDSRWMSEGLAEIVSALVLDDLGLDLETIDDVDAPTEPFQLSRWDSFLLGVGDDPRETYGYEESYRVFRELHAEIGDERFTAVLRALVEQERAYPGPDGPEQDFSSIDWRRLLDIAEQVGAAESWVDVLVDSVLIDSEVAQLDARNEAVVAFETLADRRTDWFVPEPARDAMAAWRITDALDEIELANAALDGYDRLVEALAPLDLAPAPGYDALYESGDDDLAPFVDRTESERVAADDLVEQRSELVDTLGMIAQDVPELTQRAYDADPIDIVDDVAADVADADALADALASRDEVAERYELTVAPLATDAFVVDRASALDAVRVTESAAVAVGETRARSASADSFFEQIGAVGSDTDGLLDDAAAALAAGDATEALELSERASAEIDDRASTGQRRFVGSMALMALVVVLLVAVVVRRRRRRRSVIDSAPDPAPGADPDATAGVEDDTLEPTLPTAE